MIQSVTEETLMTAATIHTEAWQASHRSFCSEAFVKAHTPLRQKTLFQEELRGGMALYMLIKDSPVGGCLRQGRPDRKPVYPPGGAE